MKKMFGLAGILILLQSADGMFLFYSLIFAHAEKVNTWIAIKGVLGTLAILYFLFIIAKIVLQWIYFVPNPEE